MIMLSIINAWIVTPREASPFRSQGRFVCAAQEFFSWAAEGEGWTMIVVSKINNNVAICRDGNQRELIAFGKGIGFPPTPYELTDLSKVERTFYNVSSKYIPLLADIPVEIIQFTARQMSDIQDKLPYEANANLVLTLADHVAFAIERAGRGIYVQMPSIYELEMNFPVEIKIGRRFVAAIKRELNVVLPKGEVQGIAMHLINARNASPEERTKIEERYEEILEQTTQIIEWELDVTVRRDTFNYARFATHLQYLLKRVFEAKHIDSDNLQMYHSIREECPEVSDCVDKISDYYKNSWSVELTEEEKLYLIMHVNRVCSQETI